VKIEPGDRSAQELLNEGWDARNRHKPEVAHDLFVAAYSLARKRKDIAGQGQALVALADNALHFHPRGDADLFAVREELSDHALALFRQIGDEQGVAEALRVRASVATDKHSHAFLEESLAICERIGDVRGVIRSLGGLGNHAALHGDGAEATRLKRKALELARGLDDEETIAELLFSLAIVFDGPKAEHRSLLEEANSIYERLGWTVSQARCLQLCAQLACDDTDWERKAEYLERSVLVARKSGDASTLCTSLDLLIDALRQQGNLARVESFECERKSLHDPFEISNEVRENLEQAFSAGDADIAKSAVRKWKSER
jgi:hypothetical protein